MVRNEGDEKLIAIDAPHFYAGAVLQTKNGIETCVAAAPILNYMKGWPRLKIEAYCRRKNWKFLLLE